MGSSTRKRQKSGVGKGKSHYACNIKPHYACNINLHWIFYVSPSKRIGSRAGLLQLVDQQRLDELVDNKLSNLRLFDLD
jgi:hypothetical protein